MSDWIILNEDTERESLENTRTGHWYRKCCEHSGFKMNGADWILCSDHGRYEISGYTDAEYQQIKANFLGRNSSMDRLLVSMLEQTHNQREEKTLRDEFAMAALSSIARDYSYDYDVYYIERMAEMAYKIADEMMEERRK